MIDELKGVIQREMERGKVPGLVIALVKGQEVVWANGYGHADLEGQVPVTPSTIFPVQSVTKPVVATALMQWYDSGRFRLDDPVNDHLGVIRLQNEWEDKTPVTVRHLLTHTSGLPVYLGAPPDGAPPSLEEYLAGVLKAVRPPGEDIVYANWGYDAIGYLVGRFAGVPYDEYLSQRVLQPLGMRSSAIGQAPGGAPAAGGFFLSAIDGQHHGVAPPTWETRPPGGAAGLLSTAEDLSRFLIAHLNGGEFDGVRVLSEQAVSEMHRLHAPAGRTRSGMGLGFRVDWAYGRRLVCHGGDGTGWTTFVGVYPDEKVGVVLLINLGRAQTTRSIIANTALRMLAGDYHRNDHKALEGVSPPREWKRIVGRYLSTYWDFDSTVAIEDGAPVLNATGPFVVSNGGAKSYLEPIADGVFRAHDGAFDGFELSFEYGDDGKAVRFYGGLYPFRFDRQGDALPAAALAVDEEAVLVGRWSGTCFSAIGPLPAVVDVGSGDGRVTVLTAEDLPVEEFRAERGRVTGHFDLTVPGLGELEIFLRLHAAADGMLRGRVYARGAFGEAPMRAEFARE